MLQAMRFIGCCLGYSSISLKIPHFPEIHVSRPAAPGRLNQYFATLKTPSAFFAVCNWLKDVPDKDRKEPSPTTLLLSHFCEYQGAWRPGFCASVARYQSADRRDDLGAGTFASCVRCQVQAMAENPQAEGWEFYRVWRMATLENR